tara:strand:+ start:1558 stop:3195 length:1638 start_codon:yes stop_codon:yes gene_type:complete
MAITDRNIVITPNRTAVGNVQPKIVFTGADSGIGDSSAITLFANPENSGTLSFSGTAGQLFSITNNLTGTIFSVNDISGIPSLSVNDQGVIQLAEFNGRVIIGDSVGSDDSVSSLQISGAVTADSATINGDVTFDSAGAILFDKSDQSLNFGNNYKAKFGPVAGGGGLSITHTGSFGFIDTNFVQIRNNGGTKVAAQFFPTNAQILKHDGNTKFETTDSGINVFGNIRINNNPFPASAIATGTIDSARLPVGTFTTGGTDSATVIALIDSSYVQSRVAVGSINNVKNDAFTGNASTTSFGLSVTPADSDDVLVFVNGVLQHTSTYSLSGSTITLDSAPDSSSTIDIRSHLIHSTSISLRDFQNYIYTLSSTLDSVSGADSGGNTLTYDADKVDVYVNGARLVNGKDYTAGNGTQIVFDSALHSGNIIEVVSHSKATALEPELTSVDVSLDSAGANQAIYSFSKSAFRTFKFTAQLSHSSSSSFHSEEVLLTHNGTTVAMTTYAQVLLDSNLGSFDATISGSNVQLKLSPTKTNVGIKLRGVRTQV